MIIFPVAEGTGIIVVEPGNIRLMKEGRPLKVGPFLIAYTPDPNAFLKLLGANVTMPGPGGGSSAHACSLTIEQIEEALAACKGLPEVER